MVKKAKTTRKQNTNLLHKHEVKNEKKNRTTTERKCRERSRKSVTSSEMDAPFTSRSLSDATTMPRNGQQRAPQAHIIIADPHNDMEADSDAQDKLERNRRLEDQTKPA